MAKNEKQVTKTVEKSDMPQPETVHEREFLEVGEAGNPFPLLVDTAKRNADAAERIARDAGGKS